MPISSFPFFRKLIQGYGFVTTKQAFQAPLFVTVSVYFKCNPLVLYEFMLGGIHFARLKVTDVYEHCLKKQMDSNGGIYL